MRIDWILDGIGIYDMSAFIHVDVDVNNSTCGCLAHGFMGCCGDAGRRATVFHISRVEITHNGYHRFGSG